MDIWYIKETWVFDTLVGNQMRVDLVTVVWPKPVFVDHLIPERHGTRLLAAERVSACQMSFPQCGDTQWVRLSGFANMNFDCKNEHKD